MCPSPISYVGAQEARPIKIARAGIGGPQTPLYAGDGISVAEPSPLSSEARFGAQRRAQRRRCGGGGPRPGWSGAFLGWLRRDGDWSRMSPGSAPLAFEHRIVVTG